jgi:hypothetical protein
MVIKTPNGRNTQVWWFDQASLTIKTKLNNQSFDIQNSGKTNNMQVWSTNSNWWQFFQYKDEQFVNYVNKKVLDVSGGKDTEGQPVIVWSAHKGANQRWNVVYLDKAKKVPTDGFDEDFGFHRNRAFYIVSRMPMNRVAQAHGNSNIQLNRWRKNTKAQ